MAEKDCISRQDAIEAVCSTCGIVIDYKKCEAYTGSGRKQCKALSALRSLPREELTPAWRSLWQELPVPGEHVLVKVFHNSESGGLSERIGTAFRSEEGRWIVDADELDDDLRYGTVLAWMPLTSFYAGPMKEMGVDG